MVNMLHTLLCTLYDMSMQPTIMLYNFIPFIANWDKQKGLSTLYTMHFKLSELLWSHSNEIKAVSGVEVLNFTMCVAVSLWSFQCLANGLTTSWTVLFEWITQRWRTKPTSANYIQPPLWSTQTDSQSVFCNESLCSPISFLLCSTKCSKTTLLLVHKPIRVLLLAL